MTARLKIADALVLDMKNKPDEGEEGAKFAHAKNPLHNLAHPTVMFLPDDGGPMTAVFANGIARQSRGHGGLLAVLAPGICPSPKTLMIPEVTLASGAQVFTMWGPVQEAVAHAIADLVKDKIITKEEADKWLCIVQVYVDPAAFDTDVLWQTQYRATYIAGEKAWKGTQDQAWVEKHAETVFHPFGLGSAEKVATAKAAARKLEAKYFAEPKA